MTRVRVPALQDIPNAIQSYYEKHELTNRDIIALFGCCAATAKKLKDMARELMGERDVPSWNALAVNTDCAFEAWGLNINDLERRYQKLRKYGMVNYEKPNNRRNAQEEGTVQGMSAQAAALPHMV